MIRLLKLRLAGRQNIRPVLIAIAVLLFAINGARLAVGYYGEQRELLESKMSILEKHQLTTRKLVELRSSVAALEDRKEQVERFLFEGSTEEEVASGIQIMLQEKMVAAGLETESLRPIRQGGGARGQQENEYGEILVKARLSGTLAGFVDFISELYRSDKLFKIDSFSLKGYKNTSLKIFIEIKGYYKIINES